MAKEKNKNMYRPIKNPELLDGKKESPQEILNRGSRGNSSGKEWVKFEEKRKQPEVEINRNYDAKFEARKKQIDKRQNLKQPDKSDKEYERDKD